MQLRLHYHVGCFEKNYIMIIISISVLYLSHITHYILHHILHNDIYIYICIVLISLVAASDYQYELLHITWPDLKKNYHQILTACPKSIIHFIYSERSLKIRRDFMDIQFKIIIIFMVRKMFRP